MLDDVGRSAGGRRGGYEKLKRNDLKEIQNSSGGEEGGGKGKNTEAGERSKQK